MKKLRLFILTIIMLFTVLPVNIFAEGEDKTFLPDVTVFATKKQMMDGTFAPESDGTADIKARIQFGKDEYGADYRWFILKADEGVKGDNTIIFSMDFIAKERLFNSSSQEKVIYDYTNDDTTVYSKIDSDNDGKVTVSGNHYGASDLRKDLIAMASNENMFSPAEQELMNATPIKTYDANNDKTYTTSDKLYAMSSSGNNNKVKLGSSDQLTVSTNTYVSYHPARHGWLRTPDMGWDPEDGGNVYYLESLGTAETVPYNSTINPGILVIPASNLNLTDVLFSSAAKSGSTDIIESDTVMRLRLNGKDKNIGEVYYDEVAEEIIVSKGTAENKVHLIVQGRGSTPYYKQNWYYSKEITGTETIKASDIKQALGLSSDPSLANSKIWLEITDTDGMKYAVEAKAVQEISDVEVKIDVPEAGQDLATEVLDITEGVNVDSIAWDTSDTTAGFYQQYKAIFELSPKFGYKFADSESISVTVNDSEATIDDNAPDSLTVSYTFDPTAKDEFDSIPAISMEVDSADDIKTEKFPKEADVIGKSGIVYKVRVMEWKKDSVNPLKYQGILAQLPEALKHNFNDAPATVELVITIKPAEVVQTPAPVKNNGYYIPDTAVR